MEYKYIYDLGNLPRMLFHYCRRAQGVSQATQKKFLKWSKKINREL